ncbi:MAG: GNAT family N-acetyltransferase [Dehalococcoidales bacterium]|nr:GNAT family N-acetyltransferase [Dehalococcoidales bacterium]
MDSPPVIRPVEAEDMAVLNESLPGGRPPEVHRERYRKQVEGRGVYATAWQGERLAGILFVDWEGSAAEPVRASFPGCPHLIDLFVLPEYRKQGIATQLLDYAEAEARQRGHERIGLDVGDLAAPNYRIAHGIYIGRGYVDTGIEHMDAYTVVDESGSVLAIQERVRFMVKEMKPANA